MGGKQLNGPGVNMITFLPLDLTGRLATNKREDESHILTRIPNKKNRACALYHGAFYVDGLIVRDGTGRLLEHGDDKDFVAAYNYGDLSSLTAKEIMAMLVIVNAAVVSPITVTYQAVGGAFGISTLELKALMQSLEEGNFKLKWEDIIGKPTAYVPEDHPHEWWQLWGMESTVTEIDRIANAWKYGTKALERENESYGDAYLDKAQAELDAYTVKVRAHLTDLDNPHNTDAAKAGLGYVNNWTMANASQVLDRNDANHYLPIGAIYRILATGPLVDLQNHISDPNNPHGTVALDADCYTKQQVDNTFLGKYLWTDVATNANLFGGRNLSQTRYDVTTFLDPKDIVFGGFPHTQLGYGGVGIGTGEPGNQTWDWALCGDGWWRRWKDLLAPANAGRLKYVVLSGVPNAASAVSTLNAAYSGPYYPVGSFAFAPIYLVPSPDVTYTQTLVFRRDAGSWVHVQ